MAFVPFTKDDQPTMAAFNERFQQAIDEAVSRGVKIEVGSYVGTGTYGSSNPNSLTFEFEPRLVVIVGAMYSDGTYVYTLTLVNPLTVASAHVGSGNKTGCLVTWSGKSVSWYNNGSSGQDGNQLNYSGKTYCYVALG